MFDIMRLIWYVWLFLWGGYIHPCILSNIYECIPTSLNSVYITWCYSHSLQNVIHIWLPQNAIWTDSFSEKDKKSEEPPSKEVVERLKVALEDLTAVCILEGFQKQDHLMLVDTLGKPFDHKRWFDSLPKKFQIVATWLQFWAEE